MPKKLEKNLQELIKSLRGNLKLDDVNWEEPDNIYRGMSENDKREFHNQIHAIKGNRAFKRLIDFLVNKQIIYTVLEAENYEQMLFGRASINGVMLVDEYIDQIEKVWQGENPREENFDKHFVI